MLENKFEKNVQQEMQGFKIKPSEEVWLKVKERIREKKKRRLFFIIFFIGGLALLGYLQRDFLFNREKPNLALKPNIEIKQEKGNTSNNPPVSKTETKKENISKEKTTDNKQQVTNNQTKNLPEKNITTVIKNKKSSTKTPQAIVVVENPKTYQQTTPLNKKEETETLKQPATKDLVKEITVAKEKQNIDKNISEINAELKNQKDDVTENEIKDSVVALISANTKTDSTAIKNKLTVTTKKWRWGFHFTPGISLMAKNLFSISANKSLDYSSPQSGSGGAVPPAGPSASSPGFAFQAGVFAQRKISSRLQLSIGLQYSYYSSRIRVGGSRDSIFNLSNQFIFLRDASNIFSASNATKNYTNSYHFAELPVTLHIQLNKNSGKPFYLNLGFTAGQMIGSNALVYDTSFGGIYIKSKKLFNKTQFSLSSGLMWSIPGKKLQWNTGPVFDIHISRLQNNAFDPDKYLLMYGLKTRIIFSSKK